MTNKPAFPSDPLHPPVYQIRIKGRLDRQWANWFEELTLTPAEGGDTLLTGPVADQAALHGLLKKVRDLGLPLVSVVQVQYRSKKEMKMNIQKSTVGIDPRLKLSLLWIFVIVNMAYADILSLMDPTSVIRGIMAGSPLPAGGLLAGAIVMETSFAMVILPWVLNYRGNRWVSGIIGIFMAWQIMIGGHGLYYAFFATVEVACIVLTIWFSWKWRNLEG